MDNIVTFFQSKVIFESHIETDWSIYLIILLEISQLYEGSRDNLANEVIVDIIVKFLNLNPLIIAYSIGKIEELFQDKLFCLRKLENPKEKLIQLFTIQFTLPHNSTIDKQQNLQTKLLWYNVLLLCNQKFNKPDDPAWTEHLINQFTMNQLSIFDKLTLNTIWKYGVQFSLKLDLSSEKRISLSCLINCVSSDIKTFSFHNFNTIIDFIMKLNYSISETVDFLSCHSKTITNFSNQSNPLIEKNSKEYSHMICVALSKLAILMCTAHKSDKSISQFNICKNHWFEILKLLISSMLRFYMITIHNPKDFADVLRYFYDTIKIPTAPEALVKPWIKEHKKEMVILITNHLKRIDIETFYEILIRFPVPVLSKIAIFDYFSKYQPPKNISIKSQLWQDLLTIIFRIKDPPNSISKHSRRYSFIICSVTKGLNLSVIV